MHILTKHFIDKFNQHFTLIEKKEETVIQSCKAIDYEKPTVCLNNDVLPEESYAHHKIKAIHKTEGSIMTKEHYKPQLEAVILEALELLDTHPLLNPTLQAPATEIVETPFGSYNKKDLENGYYIVGVTGLLNDDILDVIQKVDVLPVLNYPKKFDNDTEAGEQALKDGIKLFTDEHEDVKGWYLLDTPENHAFIKKLYQSN